jgi:hypothetical protein
MPAATASSRHLFKPFIPFLEANFDLLFGGVSRKGELQVRAHTIVELAYGLDVHKNGSLL